MRMRIGKYMALSLEFESLFACPTPLSTIAVTVKLAVTLLACRIET